MNFTYTESYLSSPLHYAFLISIVLDQINKKTIFFCPYQISTWWTTLPYFPPFNISNPLFRISLWIPQVTKQYFITWSGPLPCYSKAVFVLPAVHRWDDTGFYFPGCTLGQFLFFLWEISSCPCRMPSLSTPSMLSKGRTGASTACDYYHSKSCQIRLDLTLNLLWDSMSNFYHCCLHPKFFPVIECEHNAG